MTSESANDSQILEPKKRDYENALAAVRGHLNANSANYQYHEVCVVVEKILTMLVESSPDPYFYPFKKGTIFYRNWAYGFSTMQLFNRLGTAEVDIETQIFWLFSFVYAYRLESVLRASGLNDLDVAVFSLAKRSAFPSFASAQLEVFRARITVAFSVDLQHEVRQSLRSDTEASEARLGKMVGSIKSWEEKLDYWKDKTTDLAKLIKEQHEDLNFVGLSKAFSNLIEKRTTELAKASRSVKIFGLVSIAFPLSALLIGAVFHSKNNFDWSFLTYAIPSITVELLLLYFFRIALRNEYSVKAQLLQLELRYSVCAFIQGYADFAKNARASDDDKTLEKFEALVFSGITADIQNIPSQFDGIEQLVSLIKGMRGKN